METVPETTEARIARLVPSEEISPSRLESLTIAHAAGVDDDMFRLLAESLRLSRTATIVLPPHHYEGLSRGRGWCRKGRGDGAEWGEREDGGYRVGPGKWSVGGHDGFRRKKSDEWLVKHVTVGAATWTVAS